MEPVAAGEVVVCEVVELGVASVEELGGVAGGEERQAADKCGEREQARASHTACFVPYGECR